MICLLSELEFFREPSGWQNGKHFTRCNNDEFLFSTKASNFLLRADQSCRLGSVLGTWQHRKISLHVCPPRARC